MGAATEVVALVLSLAHLPLAGGCGVGFGRTASAREGRYSIAERRSRGFGCESRWSRTGRLPFWSTDAVSAGAGSAADSKMTLLRPWRDVGDRPVQRPPTKRSTAGHAIFQRER